MNNLQPLKWVDHTTVDYIDHRAQGAGVLYRVCHFADKFRVYWVDSMGGSDGNKEFDILDELKHWVDTDHYPHKMQPYVKPSPTWIDASKQLPQVDFNMQFICAYDSAIEPYVRVATFCAAINEFDYQHDDVLAWMTIPEFSTMQNLHNASEVTK